MSQFILSGLQVHAEEDSYSESSVLIQDGIIHTIHPGITDKNIETFAFPASYHLVPGFIDLHLHGANGADVMDATPEALAIISKALAKEGTTGFLATTMAADVQDIENTLSVIRHFVENASQKIAGASLLGIHLEGPFLSPDKIGAHLADKIIPPDIGLMQRWRSMAQNLIKLVTLAPEQAHSLAFIHYLCQQDIVPAIGHSNANYQTTQAAIDAGCCYITHLFNAMRGIHQREPGVVTAALLAEKVMVELIVDGIHLHPAIVELAYKMKGEDNIVLVTDAIRAKCLGEGCYELGGQNVTVKAGAARLADGTLAGSILPLCTAMKNMMTFTHCPLRAAIKMTAENPAKVLGLFHRKGSIAPNKDADLVVLDDEMNVVLTLCGGKVAFSQAPVAAYFT